MSSSLYLLSLSLCTVPQEGIKVTWHFYYALCVRRG